MKKVILKLGILFWSSPKIIRAILIFPVIILGILFVSISNTFILIKSIPFLYSKLLDDSYKTEMLYCLGRKIKKK